MYSTVDAKLNYHETVRDLYRDAATRPADDLCCVAEKPRYLPGLVVPDIMHEMNYGCGSTVHLQDMRDDQRVLYVGVGGGLELLQLAYFARRPGAVIGVDPVAEMRDAAEKNLRLAAESNSWFDPSFVDIRDGDALNLPIENGSIDIAAQNCLFNIFDAPDLARALSEIYRVLRQRGRLVMSDPITPGVIPGHLSDDSRLRAMCLSGCLQLDEYLNFIVKAGFGAIEVRSRRPYRVLDATTYELSEDLLLETIEVAALRVPVPQDGPCIFTGRYAIYTGPEECYDDNNGHVLRRNLPVAVCDKTCKMLQSVAHMAVTESTWHYLGDGCC
ncbi:MAG: arsenosugar biosynthesis arsenite methyltransferase ArsM [Planctomycetota bacterium]